MTDQTQMGPDTDVPLTVAERVVLRGAAHALKPTVTVGSVQQSLLRLNVR
jgi:hypothetical protein